MHFVVLDIGSISPAYFSQPVIRHLHQLGHTIEILHTFDAKKCAEADLVWSEWCNEIAFEAAASGVCKRLVLRMRGYDVWFPLDQLNWKNVDALVYESQTLKELAENQFAFLKEQTSWVMPAGINLTKFPWKKRKPGNVFALVARATADKGYQLAMEWARQNPQHQLHVTLAFADQNPRLARYMEHSAPPNVYLCGKVDTATWLNDIDANFLLLPSIWETLSYTVAEAMALGIKPLIHDFPGAKTNWPEDLVWRSFEDLNALVNGYYDSRAYGKYVLDHLDGAIQSDLFATLLLGLIKTVTRTPSASPAQGPTVPQVYGGFMQAILTVDLDKAEKLAEVLSAGAPKDIATTAAVQLAGALYDRDQIDRSRMWALTALAQGPRADVLCLLGEIESEENPEAALEWYKLACSQPNTRSRFVLPNLEEGRHERLQEISAENRPALEQGPAPKYWIIVPVRNAEKWIEKCLESIVEQRNDHWVGGNRVQCVVTDDDSTDGTAQKVRDFVASHEGFRFVENVERMGSLFNICWMIKNELLSQPEDVIVIVDGDDWLQPNALRVLDESYQRGAWMTYGSWRDTSGKLSWMGAYPVKVAQEGLHRQHPWCATHLKTFKRFLFDKVDMEDFKDDKGNWLTIGGDVALMIPMLEMAQERAVYVPEVLYTYNNETPDNDHKIAPRDQMRVRDLVFAKRPYPRLSTQNTVFFRHITVSEMAAVRKWVHDDATIFDVGCASGEWSSYSCGSFSGLKVYAFDPRPEAGSRIRRGIGTATIQFIEKAMSDVEGVRTFYRYLGGVEGSSFYPRSYLLNGSARQEIEVPTTTIDIYVEENDIKIIDFLKIDTEGHDVFVLRGAKRILRERVRVVQFENGIIDGGVTLSDAFECLKGFKIYELIDGAEPVLVTDPTKSSAVNYLAVNEVLGEI